MALKLLQITFAMRQTPRWFSAVPSQASWSMWRCRNGPCQINHHKSPQKPPSINESSGFLTRIAQCVPRTIYPSNVTLVVVPVDYATLLWSRYLSSCSSSSSTPSPGPSGTRALAAGSLPHFSCRQTRYVISGETSSRGIPPRFVSQCFLFRFRPRTARTPTLGTGTKVSRTFRHATNKYQFSPSEFWRVGVQSR